MDCENNLCKNCCKVAIKYKECRLCKKKKSEPNFSKGRRICKECQKERNHNYYDKNKYIKWKNMKKPSTDNDITDSSENTSENI